MSVNTTQLSPIKRQEYRSRALQFLSGLAFPATKEQVLDHYTRRNSSMELLEDTLALQAGTYATAGAFADAVTAQHATREPHTWVSREIRD